MIIFSGQVCLDGVVCDLGSDLEAAAGAGQAAFVKLADLSDTSSHCTSLLLHLGNLL